MYKNKSWPLWVGVIAFIFLFLALTVSAQEVHERIGETKEVNLSVSSGGGLSVTPAGAADGLTESDVMAIANQLVGDNVQILDVRYQATWNSLGTFTSDDPYIVGFDSGIILSTGKIDNVVGPNKSSSISYVNNLPGDPDLASLIPNYTIYEATYLEIDFIPQADVISFSYVFASDEYPQWVGSSYNDVFGFFVNGVNMATIPGTDNLPVAINNVNFNDNAQYFRENRLPDAPINTEMDGLTTVLTFNAPVTKGQQNTIKLGIADAGDRSLDSNVFIKAGSLSAIDAVPVEGVQLNKSSTYLEVGKSEQLAAQVMPANATNKNVSWQSSDPNVVTVSNGLITGNYPGEAIVTVTTADGGYQATCLVTVTEDSVPVQSVSVEPASLSIPEGSTAFLKAVVSPANATNQSVTWSSADPSVATVGSSGIVNALKPGQTTVTAKTLDGNYSASANVTVTAGAVIPPSEWTGIVGLPAEALEFVDHGKLAASFAGYGVYLYDNAWSSAIAPVSAQLLEYDDGVLAASFDGFGVYTTSNLSSWDPIVSVPAQAMAYKDGILAGSYPGYGVFLFDTSFTNYLSASSGGGLSVTPAGAEDGLTESDVMAIANQLVGDNVQILDVRYQATWNSIGTFTSDDPYIIGFDNGIILSTGKIEYVVGPNTSDSKGYENYLDGDSDLNDLIPGYSTYDATYLEIDFIPQADVVSFSYVFSSDEYPEFVDSAYNDVFGFFVNGVNMATVPGTDNLPVAINNVNHKTNSQYYKANHLYDQDTYEELTPNFNTEMDGLTTVLTFNAPVNKGQQNTIKLGIADAGDRILDSNVFIKAGSLSAIDAVSVEGVQLNKSSTYLEVGKSEQLAVQVMPANATNKNVSWQADDVNVLTSSNSDVVSVSNGLITGLAPGEAIVTVTTADGGYKATCLVTVTTDSVPVQSVTVEPSTLSIPEGSTAFLKAVVYPEYATNQAVNWSSADPSVATVGSSGIVNALKPGQTTITATTIDGNLSASASVTVTAGDALPTSPWNWLTPADAIALAYDDSGMLAASFPGFGLYLYDGNWKVPAIAGVSAEVLAYADGKLAASFAGFGVYVYENNSWEQITPVSALDMAYDNGMLAASFAGIGVYLYANNSWEELTDNTANVLAFNDGVIAASFEQGVYLYGTGN